MWTRIWLLALVCLCYPCFSDDCRYYKNCGQYSREPYDVTYSYPGDHWHYEKDLRDDGPVIKARTGRTGIPYYPPQRPPVEKLIPARETGKLTSIPRDTDLGHRPLESKVRFKEEAYSHPVAPVDQDLLFRFDDSFPLGTTIYSYVTQLADHKGREYLMRIEWSGYYEMRKRSLFHFLSKKKYVHYVKVTIDGRLLFAVDDYVDQGAYDYEDYFRLGDRKYRLLVKMQSSFDEYYLGANLNSTL
jgi:hypothetical protein